MTLPTLECGFDSHCSLMKKTLIKFYADWCGPCKPMSTVVQRLEKEFDLTIESVDIDYDMELAESWAVNSVPTLILLKEDRTEDVRVVGAQPYDRVVKALGLDKS